MAEKQEPSAAALPGPAPLQRGKACLRCRKRKMRCDGQKPACAQCVRAKKHDACEYDDGKGKTRTQIMREHIARLEMRIKELENPEQSAPSMQLFDPHAISPYPSDSSSSSYESPGKLSFSSSPSPFPLADQDARRTVLSPLAINDPSMADHWDPQIDFTNFVSAMQTGAETFGDIDVPGLDHMLINIFIPHRHQCGLELHVGRLQESLNLAPSEQHHPVLYNAMSLWACYLSRPDSVSQYEQAYLARTITSISDAMQYPSRTVDLIQACCLLSVYYLSNGRLFEGGYYCGVASTMAVQARLHQLGTERQRGLENWAGSFELPPAKDSIEHGERILAFWQVYILDRCWSVILRRPCCLPDSDHPWASITTPFPQRMEDYEQQGDLDVGGHSPETRSVFTPSPSPAVTGFSTIALRVKASAIFEGANRLSSSWGPAALTSNGFLESFSAFEHSIVRFVATLLPLHQVGAAIPEDKYTLIVIHSLAHASMIRLHAPFLRDDSVSREKCLRAARALIHVTKHITDGDFEYLDPIIGSCWVSAARVLELELARIESSWDPLSTMEIRQELEALLYVITKLGAKFPLLAYHSAKIQNTLDGK